MEVFHSYGGSERMYKKGKYGQKSQYGSQIDYRYKYESLDGMVYEESDHMKVIDIFF